MDKGLLIDRLGELKIKIAKLELQEKELVNEINKEVGKFEGNFYIATVFEVTQTLIDKDKVKALLTEEQYSGCFKQGKTHNSVRITPRIEAR